MHRIEPPLQGQAMENPMATYEYRCKNCNEAFTLSLTAAQREQIDQLLSEKRGATTPEIEALHCDFCTVAELEPMISS